VSASSLSALRDRPVALVAIGYMFVTNLDSIFVIPLLPVLHGGTPASIARDVALALSLRLGASLLFSLLLPAVAPRAANAKLLMASSLMKAGAFLSILALPVPHSLWCFALLAGAGTGTLRPAVRAVIADETRGAGQALAFQALFLAMNVAFVLGPLMAEAAVRLELVAAGVLAVTLLEVAAGLAALRLVPPRSAGVSDQTPRAGGLESLRRLSGGIWLLLLQSLLAYAAVGFFIASLVLFEAINRPLAGWRNALLSAEGLAVIAVQLALMPLFARLPRTALHAAVALTAPAGLALCFTPSLPLAFLGLLIFAFAECLAMPAGQLELAERAPAEARRSVFAMGMVAAALGESAGAWMAWAVTRAEVAGLSLAAAAQGASLAVGGGLALVAWALARRPQRRSVRLGPTTQLAQERR
jgi:hypothetical protein